MRTARSSSNAAARHTAFPPARARTRGRSVRGIPSSARSHLRSPPVAMPAPPRRSPPPPPPERLIRALKPDVFVKGGDYTRETLPEAPLVESLGGTVRILPFTPDRSTTRVIEHIRAGATAPPNALYTDYQITAAED